MDGKLKIAVIGGGAAGFFAAINVKEQNPTYEVTILEKSNKLLSKVKVSGGGRCNVTNEIFDTIPLSKKYPRGENFLKKAFGVFNSKDTLDWFSERGVPLEIISDGCVFPKSNSSQSIIDCFLFNSKKLGIEILIKNPVDSIIKFENGFHLKSVDETLYFDKVIVTIGGQPKKAGLNWLEDLGHEIIEPLPSLFTFNMPNNPICKLMGNVVEKATVKIESTKLISDGPLLVTHWGMSGPAILKLSAWGARILESKNYEFSILVNWLDKLKDEELKSILNNVIKEHSNKKVLNYNPFPFTNRLWEFLLEKSSINNEMRWNALSLKAQNKLINTLINDRYEVKGKTTFKEEFVTAGGVSLNDIDVKTMESKKVPGIYFAGEVMDIDGITGGFNFQAAWTTAFVVSRSI
jgi:predicted Rossmann fold flavoprotein